ncbi:hypothetical protein ACFCYF_37565 [Streptomyces chartreusis]|uniref:hypothetical protein n=1 Tax=Streptomyces chartreusis TaxID=1969 RepID=UPI0035DF0759
MNRSSDPVGRPRVTFRLRIFSDDEYKPDTVTDAVIFLDALPPCTLQTIESGQLRTRTNGKLAKLPSRFLWVSDPYFQFADSGGRLWGRINDHLVSNEELAKSVNSRNKADKGVPIYKRVEVILEEEPKRSSTPNCEDNAK